MEKIVLLIEDNPDDVLLTRLAFKQSRSGDKLIVARDGEEALDYLICAGGGVNSYLQEIPALVLLDLKLPGMDGLEVLRQIREHPRICLLPVVILSSSSEQQDIICSYQLGANSYICKPVDFNHFTQLLVQLGSYWLEINQGPPAYRTGA